MGNVMNNISDDKLKDHVSKLMDYVEGNDSNEFVKMTYEQIDEMSSALMEDPVTNLKLISVMVAFFEAKKADGSMDAILADLLIRMGTELRSQIIKCAH
jgi:hypothetical protein